MKSYFKSLCALAVVSCALSSVAVAATVGEAAPDFELEDIHGTSHALSDFKGKTVVLEWINFGCPYVKKHYESGNMQGLQEYAEGKDVVWLSICSSVPGKQGNMDTSKWQAAYEKQGMASAAVLIDDDSKVGRLYNARTTPHMFVINDEGTLVYNGAIDSIRSTSSSDIAEATNYVKAALDSILSGEEIDVATSKPYGCSVKY